jgi:glycosyltransferase involved in cell wall biosynthesis
MTIELTEYGIQNVKYLEQKYQLSRAEVVDRALALLSQEDKDWDLIFSDDGLNDDLTESQADDLALEAQRAVRANRKK